MNELFLFGGLGIMALGGLGPLAAAVYLSVVLSRRR